MLSKDEVSNLTSLIERRIQCELDLDAAKRRADDAQYKLANFLRELQQTKTPHPSDPAGAREI